MQTQAKLLDSVILEPKQVAERSVIWLHGLGADGHDFSPIIPQLNIQEQYKVRFIFPHAPSIPVTLNNGYVMPAWFDIYGIDEKTLQAKHEDSQGIIASQQLVNQLIIEEHNKGVAYSNILLAGFSQGGALALYTGLKFSHQLAGIVGLSCYLPRFDDNYHAANKKTPIMLAHGEHDAIVLSSIGERGYHVLQKLNYNVSWFSYPMQHQVCTQEILDIAEFMKTIFS